MVFLPSYPGDVLPFSPLPDSATNAAHDSMVQRGFERAAILEAYRYTSRAGSFTLNALAFSDPRRRTPDEFAGITLYNAVNGIPDEQIIPILAQTSAPFHLLHRDNRFAFWASTIQDENVRPVPIQTDIAYDQLDAVLGTYAVDLAPTRIFDVKQGRAEFSHPFLRTIQPRQLALWAFDVTHNLLVQHFGDAVTRLRNHPFYQNLDAAQREKIVVDLAVQLLGAVILADTGVLGNEIRHKSHTLTLDNLIQAAYKQHPNYFRLDLFVQHAEPATAAYRMLRQICYAGFVPDMLSDLYITAYDKETRKKLGRFDTPLYLTRRIWDTIPVEFLQPEKRITVDMTCGWGSFLIAGYDRLAQMNDMRGRQLRNYIYGNDRDPFTARLAGLGLLLATSIDSWHIDDQDALDWNWLNTHQPGIIVGNPPFGGRRDHPETLDALMPQERRTRVEAANRFMQRVIRRLAPTGYMAMVLPRSFLASEAAPAVRRELLETCDVIEIWQLPGKLFRDATVQPIVLLAQKRTLSHSVNFPVRVRNIQSSTLETFETEGIFTASNIVVNQFRWHTSVTVPQTLVDQYVMDTYAILHEQQWQQLRANSRNIADIVTIFPGLTRGSNPQSKRHLQSKEKTPVMFLTDARYAIPRSWYIDYTTAQQALYPDDFSKPRLQYQNILNYKKILLFASTNPSWGRRSKAVIERRGIYPSFSFWVIAPEPVPDCVAITEEVIAAVLNWYVSNAWVSEHRSYPKIERRIVETIPFPRHLSEVDCVALTAAVQELEHAAANNLPLPGAAQDIIDTILKTAYQLDDATFERLRMIAEWDHHPQVTLDPQPDRSSANYLISGVVEQVDAEQGTITLWMSGFDALQTVPIDPQMPGWMLRPEAAFRARIPYACEYNRSLEAVVWGRITPQEYTYLSEEVLVARLTDVFYPDKTGQP